MEYRRQLSPSIIPEASFQSSNRPYPPLAFGSLEPSNERVLENGNQQSGSRNLFSLGYDELLGPHPTTITGANEGQYRRSSSQNYEESEQSLGGPSHFEREGRGIERSHSGNGEGSNNFENSRAQSSGAEYQGHEDRSAHGAPYSSTSTLQGGYFPGDERERTNSRYNSNSSTSATTPTANALLMSPLSPLVAPFSPASGGSSISNLPWAPQPPRSNPNLSNDRGTMSPPLDLRSYPQRAQQVQQQHMEQQQQMLYEQERERAEDYSRQQAHFDRLEFIESQSTPIAPRGQSQLTQERNLPSLGLSGMGDYGNGEEFNHSLGEFGHEINHGQGESWNSAMSYNELREDRRDGLRGISRSGIAPSGGGSSVEGSNTMEEISTIFVVGFPEDMLEREFQNMFVLSIGFEAATLKIPSGGKSGGSVAGSDRPSTGNYQDLYGGMLEGSIYDEHFAGSTSNLDSTGSISTLPHMLSNLSATRSSAGSPALARKQIIGFAKFRTRAQALEVRDLLSGKKVDAEKGSVLKAEMAKKNLHTKRGISNELGINSLERLNNASTLNPAVLAELARQNAVAQQQQLNSNSNPVSNSNSLGSSSGLQSAAAFDAFHSVPQATGIRRDREQSGIPSANYPSAGSSRGRVRQGTSSELYYEDSPPIPPSAAYYSLPRSEGPSSIASPSLAQPQRFPQAPPRERHQTTSPDYADQQQQRFEESQGGWTGKSLMQHLDQGNELDREHQQQLIYQAHQIQLQNLQTQQQNILSERQQEHFRLQQISTALNPQQQQQQQQQMNALTSQMEGNYIGEDRNAYQNAFQNNLMGRGGAVPMAPTLSGGASASIPRTQNPADMNAPKNTLYVGGLPAVLPSLTGPFSAAHLEDSLRNAFSRCPGFRRLCFRSKSNGPIVFVEFDDVIYATRALQDMYGNQLGGIVKGGIRLSYSKNPLGVRAGISGSPGPLSPLSINAADNIFASGLYNNPNLAGNRRPSESVFGPGPQLDYRLAQAQQQNLQVQQQQSQLPRTVGGFGNGFGSTFSPFAFEQH